MNARNFGDEGSLYRQLEVDSRASAEEITRAYRRLAHAAHPDTHPEDPDAPRRFRELTHAYELLGNPQRRASYDRFRARHGGRGVARRPEPGPAEDVHPDPPVMTVFPTVAVAPVPLCVGPVRIEPSARVSGRPIAPVPGDGLARLLAALVDTWARP